VHGSSSSLTHCSKVSMHLAQKSGHLSFDLTGSFCAKFNVVLTWRKERCPYADVQHGKDLLKRSTPRVTVAAPVLIAVSFGRLRLGLQECAGVVTMPGTGRRRQQQRTLRSNQEQLFHRRALRSPAPLTFMSLIMDASVRGAEISEDLAPLASGQMSVPKVGTCLPPDQALL